MHKCTVCTFRSLRVVFCFCTLVVESWWLVVLMFYNHIFISNLNFSVHIQEERFLLGIPCLNSFRYLFYWNCFKWSYIIILWTTICGWNIIFLCCKGAIFSVQYNHLLIISGAIFVPSIAFCKNSIINTIVDHWLKSRWGSLLLQLSLAVVPSYGGWGPDHVTRSTSCCLPWTTRQHHWGRFTGCCFVVVVVVYLALH